MKITRNKIIIALGVLAILAVTFWWGGNAPGLRGWSIGASPEAQSSQGELLSEDDPDSSEASATFVDEDMNTTSLEGEESPDFSQSKKGETSKSNPTVSAKSTAKQKDTTSKGKSSSGTHNEEVAYSEQRGMNIDQETGKDQYQTDPVPKGKPVPVEPQDVTVSNKAYTATLSVRCDTILDNMDWLNEEKWELVPEDGVVFPSTKVTFYEGESVLNILQREMKKAKIHMEFVNVPIYNSAYIEGINNLYEFDVGERSGWTYKVNGWFPNYGCSRYQLEDGDIVEWVYTCDLGVDVGGYNVIGAE